MPRTTRSSLQAESLVLHDPVLTSRPQVQLRRSGRVMSKRNPLGHHDNPGSMLSPRLSAEEDQDSGDEPGPIRQRSRGKTKRQHLSAEPEVHSTRRRTAITTETSEMASMMLSDGRKQGTTLGSVGVICSSDKVDSLENSGVSGVECPESTEGASDTVERGAARKPAINSPYLPLPWRGRLGYACLNTYLRSAKNPVFCSRTCRIASILDHRHPLMDPAMPEHPVKNRPDKSQEPSVERGLKFVQSLGLANARDMIRMLRWNDKYGIKFMRLSSEMFPFASHPEYGYRLAPFASDVLAEVGKLAAKLGHRLTMHPGQFTQLGSPRREVVEAAVRDLEYHDELLTLLRLPKQQDRDAVMIIHMGGVYGDKAATLDRFRANYARLSPSIKARLVLENDDVSWSVHDLLPVCEELDIPLVLDYHHHNIVFDSSQCREGTLDISAPTLQTRIAATWTRKGIRQKMHYSESCPGAVTPRDRRKHSPRVMTLPPCPNDMDLMIEAKDKEQAVFELMRTFKLPGFDQINDMIPHERQDEVRTQPLKKRKRASNNGTVDVNDNGGDDLSQRAPMPEVSDEDYAMGGRENRVYWPPGSEAWLKPLRRGAKVMLEDAEE